MLPFDQFPHGNILAVSSVNLCPLFEVLLTVDDCLYADCVVSACSLLVYLLSRHSLPCLGSEDANKPHQPGLSALCDLHLITLPQGPEALFKLSPGCSVPA